MKQYYTKINVLYIYETVLHKDKCFVYTKEYYSKLNVLCVYETVLHKEKCFVYLRNSITLR